MIARGGSTDVTTYFAMRLLTTGANATGLTITDFDMQYTRTREVPTAKVDAVALAATNTAHTDNRGIEVDSTGQPGLYRFDWPDAAFTAGTEVILSIKHTSCFTEHLRVELVDYNPRDGVRLGLTALPNAAADAAGGLIISDAGGLDADAQRADVAAILVDTSTTLDDLIDSEINTIVTGVADIQSRLPAALTGDGNIKADALKIDGDTPDDTAAIATAVTADMDANSTKLAAILADTAEIGAAGAGLTALATQASVDTIDGIVDAILVDTGSTLDGKIDTINTVVDAIKTKTDSLTFTVAGQVDGNIQYVNDVQVTGTGAGGDEWGP